MNSATMDSVLCRSPEWRDIRPTKLQSNHIMIFACTLLVGASISCGRSTESQRSRPSQDIEEIPSYLDSKSEFVAAGESASIEFEQTKVVIPVGATSTDVILRVRIRENLNNLEKPVLLGNLAGDIVEIELLDAVDQDKRIAPDQLKGSIFVKQEIAKLPQQNLTYVLVTNPGSEQETVSTIESNLVQSIDSNENATQLHSIAIHSVYTVVYAFETSVGENADQIRSEGDPASLEEHLDNKNDGTSELARETSNEYKNVGSIANTIANSEVPVPSLLAVNAGGAHTCTNEDDGPLTCWGLSLYGQLGDGSFSEQSDSRQARVAGNWQNVSLGENHSCGLQTDGDLFCWGANSNHQLGEGTRDDRNTPTLVEPDKQWRTVATGFAHTCAIGSDRKLFCWGMNHFGQTGNGPMTDIVFPTQVGNASDWQSISLGYGHSCGIRANGKLYCWGMNSFGQLGDGTSDYKHAPQSIGDDADWQSVALGDHTCAIKMDGRLFCWGMNGHGQLGDNTFLDRYLPTQEGLALRWKKVAVGSQHSCAITLEGGLYCWGSNFRGQVGNEITVNHNTPTQVGNASDWKDVTAGHSHNCAVKEDRQVFCWGENQNGQLGLKASDFTFSRLPQPVDLEIN